MGSRVTLGKTVVGSVLLHLIGLRLVTAGVGLQGELPVDLGSRNREMHLRLVNPVLETPDEFGEEIVPAGGPVTDTPGALADAETSSPARRMSRREARLRERVEELAEELGLDIEGLDRTSLERLFPPAFKFARHHEQRSASSYRELLRTYIDIHIGYPYAVLEYVARSPNAKVLADVHVQVDGGGRFRIVGLTMSNRVADRGGHIEGYYRRILDDVAQLPFLPPQVAGLGAPHDLRYRLLNPLHR